MRRKDKERDAAFAWQVLRDAAYSVLAMTDADGTPYCVPVNHIADPEHNAVYFHCAGAGRKWTILEKEPPVCLTAVSRAELVPGELTTAYDSAVVHGQATVVRDSAEKLYALKLLVQALDPVSMERAVMCADKTMERTMIVKITPREVTGKQSHGKKKKKQAPTGACFFAYFTSGRMPSSTSGSAPVLSMPWVCPSGQ